MNKRNPGLLRLQEALRSLEQAAVAARKRKGLPWSRRAVAQHVKKAHGASHLDRRIGEWLGRPGRAPRDPDLVWALVQVWSEWAGDGPGRQDRRYWNQLVELAQPLPSTAAQGETTPSAGSGSQIEPGAEPKPPASLETREPDPQVRRLWLPLENGVFPFPRGTTNVRMTFAAGLLDAMVETFGDRPARFTFVLSGKAYDPGESTLVHYQVWCHQREFVARASRRHREIVARVSDALLQPPSIEATRQALLREAAEAARARENWHFEGNMLFLESPVPHTVTYEPSLNRIRLAAGPARGTDPDTYEDKTTTTSDALLFACNFISRPIVDLGDPNRYAKNLATVKLITHLLDERALDFTRFRIAEDDPETWDFRYP